MGRHPWSGILLAGSDIIGPTSLVRHGCRLDPILSKRHFQGAADFLSRRPTWSCRDLYPCTMSEGVRRYDHDQRDIPVQQGKDKHYSPSRRHVRAGVSLWQGRRACAAVLSPPGRPVPSGGLSRGAAEGVSADISVSSGAAGATKPSQRRSFEGQSSHLISIRVSPCNLTLPVYKGGQGLLCEGRIDGGTIRKLHLLPLAKQLKEHHCRPIQRTIIPRQTGMSRGFTSIRGP